MDHIWIYGGDDSRTLRRGMANQLKTLGQTCGDAVNC